MKFKMITIVMAISLVTIIPTANAMRCNGALVSIGDTKYEIIAKCGEPFFDNVISVETERDKYDNQIKEVIVEQLIYDQGQNTFLKILTLKGGKLTAIEDGDRVSDNAKVKTRFTASIGDSQAEIYAKYGEPILKETVAIESTKTSSPQESTDEESHIFIEEKVELWSYSFGPGTFLKILTFKNGVLTKIENGTRQ